MDRQETATSLRRLRSAARYSLALLAGGVFAYVAWEPRSNDSAGSANSRVVAAVATSESTAVAEDSNPQ
ncbi:MAG TPA: hypothetical protein VNT79_12090 [Phycisphaerae bacterium]|nr:hypothetical protein [Phycisphaerae bacterium]